MSYPSISENEPPRVTRGVQVLIAVNVAILFLQMTLLSKDFLVSALGFSWAERAHWWSLVTYTFVHGGLAHMAINMYALFVFGPRLEQAWGTKRFISVYFWCGLGGLLLHAVFKVEGSLIGASSAVFGVMTVYAMEWPDDEIFLFGVLPMRVWTAVMLFVGTTLMMGILTNLTGGASIAFCAQLGGAITGWVYMRTPGTTSMDQFKHRIARIPDVEEPPRAIPRSQPRVRERVEEVDEIVARSKAIAAKRTVTLIEPPRRRDSKSEELNRVLDKISAQGLESLTSDERQTLEEMARKLRDS